MQKQTPQMFFQIRILKNLTNFIEKYLCWSFIFIKFRLQACNFVKKKLQRRCFPVIFANFFTVSFPVTHWAGVNTDLTSNSNISKTVKVSVAFTQGFLKEHSISFLMICRLIDFVLAVLQLLIFKVCEIIGNSKIEFFNSSSTERVKENKKIKNHSKPPKLVSPSLLNIFGHFSLKI